MNPNILKSMTVGEMTRGVYDRFAIVSNDTPLFQIEALAREHGETDMVLQNRAGDLAGLVSLGDLEGNEALDDLGTFVLAHDLVNRQTVYLTPGDNLISALEFFSDREFDKIPIVETRSGRRQLLGHVRYADILDFYKREHGSNPAAHSPDFDPRAQPPATPSG